MALSFVPSYLPLGLQEPWWFCNGGHTWQSHETEGAWVSTTTPCPGLTTFRLPENEGDIAFVFFKTIVIWGLLNANKYKSNGCTWVCQPWQWGHANNWIWETLTWRIWVMAVKRAKQQSRAPSWGPRGVMWVERPMLYHLVSPIQEGGIQENSCSLTVCQGDPSPQCIRLSSCLKLPAV